MDAENKPNFLSVELLPKLEAGGRAREAVRSAFRGLPDQVADHLLTVVSELVTNAVLHGPRQPIGLRVSLDPKRRLISGEVVDQGDPSKSIPRIREVRKGRGGGYGLRLVEAMTSDWWVVEGSTSVRFEISLESQ
jgi:anti-sigma regulatory factor (Ser/Thr protein kinase)